MDARHRQAYLRALGLTDWRLRPGAAAVGAEAAVARDSAADEPLPTPTRGADVKPDGPPPPRIESAASGPAGEAPDGAEPTQPPSGSSDDLLTPDSPAGPEDDEIDSRAAAQAEEDTMDIFDGGEPDPSVAAPCANLDWDALEAYLGECDHRGASRPVFGVGARDAQVLIVGEAPGAQEDAQGVPFVGRAGQLLDRMLFAIGCSRDTNVYITNICKFRPPDNRDPRPDEVAADWPVLERQIELMDPKLVVAVGRVAAQTLLDSKQSLGKLRGRLHRYPHRELDVLVTYHPAYLLRSPQQKRKAWDDLKQIAARIENAGGAAA